MVANRLAFLKSISFDAKAKALTCGKAKCTLEQALIVGSLAEGEVTDPTDASKVAEGVFNRLAAADYLRIDSTALYYKPLPAGQQVPTLAQVNDPTNPYSTYAHVGLPPTAINIPSDDMVKAVLSPSSDNYYYWCVTPTGTEFFKKKQVSQFDAACNVKN
jgi:UPF0755 protein